MFRSNRIALLGLYLLAQGSHATLRSSDPVEKGPTALVAQARGFEETVGKRMGQGHRLGKKVGTKLGEIGGYIAGATIGYQAAKAKAQGSTHEVIQKQIGDGIKGVPDQMLNGVDRISNSTLLAARSVEDVKANPDFQQLKTGAGTLLDSMKPDLESLKTQAGRKKAGTNAKEQGAGVAGGLALGFAGGPIGKVVGNVVGAGGGGALGAVVGVAEWGVKKVVKTVVKYPVHIVTGGGKKQ